MCVPVKAVLEGLCRDAEVCKARIIGFGMVILFLCIIIMVSVVSICTVALDVYAVLHPVDAVYVTICLWFPTVLPNWPFFFTSF